MNKIVSENLNRFISKRNLTQDELANKTKLSRNTVNKHLSLSRESNPNLGILFKYALALDIDFPQIFSKNPDDELGFDQSMTIEIYMNIYVQNLKYKLRGKNQKMLSYDQGIQESTVSEILNGNNKNPKLSTVSIISEQLGISLEQLFRRGGDIL